MTDRASRLIVTFGAGHLGVAHGIAKVLVHVADNYGDPESWDAVPAGVLYALAGELTADLPYPYGDAPAP